MNGHDIVNQYKQGLKVLMYLPEKALDLINYAQIDTYGEKVIQVIPDSVEHSRSIAGTLIKYPVTYKKRREEDTEIDAYFDVGDDWKIRLMRFRSKSCKIVEKTRTIKAVEEHFVAASPERVETYKVMECPENLAE